MEVEIVINGSSVNRWNKLGLTSNPFAGIHKAEYYHFNRILQALDSDPITSVEQLRNILKGCSEEFISACTRVYVPGEVSSFTIDWPDE